MTNCHKLWAENHRNVFSHSAGGQKSQSKVSVGPALRSSGRCSYACRNSHLCLHPRLAFSSVLCLLFSRGYLRLDLRPTRKTQVDLISRSLITPAKTPFPKEVILTGSKDLTWACLSRDHHLTHYTAVIFSVIKV